MPRTRFLRALLWAGLALGSAEAAATPTTSSTAESSDEAIPRDNSLQRRYDDFKLMRALPATQDHLEALRFLEKGDHNPFYSGQSQMDDELLSCFLSLA